MRSLRLIFAACALAAAPGDAPIASDWMGSLDINGKTLRLALHLKRLFVANRYSPFQISPNSRRNPSTIPSPGR